MGRNGTLEYARLWAAFGIVFFHAKAPGAAIGYAALPFFLILLVMMAAPAAQSHSFTHYMRSKASRLLMPWLAWSLIYGGLKLGEVLATGAPLASEFHLSMLLSGPALHLWFLPFAFAACLLVYASGAVTGSGGNPLVCALFAVLALGSLLVQEALNAPAPFNQWLYGMPAVFMGLALVSGPRHLGAQVMFITGFSALALVFGATAGLFQLVLAVSLFLFCTTAPSPETALARQAGAAAMGVYLAHPLILSVLSRTTSLQEHSLEIAIIGCLGALIFTALVINRQALRQSATAVPPTRSLG
jgi:hypothetical protein